MSGEKSTPDLVLACRFGRDEERRYAHLPFDVPAGVRQISLRCDYGDRIASDASLAGGNTLDLGLFDERGIGAGGSGFRGWSGSARSEITIDERWATPPYSVGAIGAGRWHLLLGPYKVGPRGLDYRVEIRFDAGLAEPAGPAPFLPAAGARPMPPAERGWVRADLHCHSLRSDGDAAPEAVVAAAAAAGLDIIALTDHNSPGLGGRPMAGGPLVVPGIEVTTYGGHWNAWGTDGWYEFRDPSRKTTAAAMRAAVAAGAVVAMNHPRPFGPDWTYGDGLGYHAIEVWNGAWEQLNGRALARWEEHLRRGERIVAVGGSDTHRLRRHDGAPADARLGHPTTWLEVGDEPTIGGVLAALRAGRCFVSASPTGPQLSVDRVGDSVRVRTVGAAGATLMLIDGGGCVEARAIGDDDASVEMPFLPGASYVRAQIVDRLGAILALSNAIWRTPTDVGSEVNGGSGGRR